MKSYDDCMKKVAEWTEKAEKSKNIEIRKNMKKSKENINKPHKPYQEIEYNDEEHKFETVEKVLTKEWEIDDEEYESINEEDTENNKNDETSINEKSKKKVSRRSKKMEEAENEFIAPKTDICPWCNSEIKIGENTCHVCQNPLEWPELAGSEDWCICVNCGYAIPISEYHPNLVCPRCSGGN